MSIKDEILSCDDCKVEELLIPEWKNMVIRIAEIGADARDELEQYLAVEGKSVEGKAGAFAHVRAALAVASIVDENNERVFSFSDIPGLGKKNGKAIDRIFEVSNRLNKIFGGEKDDIKKNSESNHSD